MGENIKIKLDDFCLWIENGVNLKNFKK